MYIVNNKKNLTIITILGSLFWNTLYMVKICEEFGKKNNLMFSADDNLQSQKLSVCICVDKQLRILSTQPPIQLYGVDSPWVTHTTPLGHEESQTAQWIQISRGSEPASSRTGKGHRKWPRHACLHQPSESLSNVRKLKASFVET